MSKTQHVYFITDKRRRYVKIGVSNNPWSRIQDLQAGSPLTLRLDLVLDFEDDRSSATSYEDALHQHFAEFWRFREWFNYSGALKDFVDGWKNGFKPSVPFPPRTCKQYYDEHGVCLSKESLMALLRKERQS